MGSSDPTCRILVISANIEEAESFIRLCPGFQEDEPLLTDLKSFCIEVPWTITNRYYSASVHFRLHPVLDSGGSVYPPLPTYQGVPAVIWVWSSGQGYQEHVGNLAKDMEGCGAEPEVCLGVRIAVSSSPVAPTSEDENAEIDSFLSLNGLEYIDATQSGLSPTSKGAYLEGIPGFSRVLDALGTIMWPSMEAVSKEKASMSEPVHQTQERALLDWARASQGMLSEAGDRSDYKQFTAGAMKKEITQLQQWLEDSDDYTMKDDPWTSAISTKGALSSSPTALEFGDFEEFRKQTASTTGNDNKFDDDFTVFVSAPPISDDDGDVGSPGKSGHSTPDLNQASSLGLPGRSLYCSLGSVSDFGESGDPSDDDHDDILPSKEEIKEMSNKIFVDTRVSPSETEEYEIAPFDLSKVLGALEEMKAEISLIENDDERRKAAAKVALGLVYGLEEE